MGELVETQAAAAGVTFHRERAGGTISFTSEEGVGTTYTIEFRFLLAPETEKEDNNKDNTMQDFQGTQVLLVEDNELNMEIAEFFLTRCSDDSDHSDDGKSSRAKKRG